MPEPSWTLVQGNTYVQVGTAQGSNFLAANLYPSNSAYSGGSTATTSTGVCNQNTETGGKRFFDETDDVNGFTIITHSLTLSGTTNLSESCSLGIRAVGGNAASTTANYNAKKTSRIDIYNMVTGATILTSYGDICNTGKTALSTGSVLEATGWEINTFSANNVPAGSYAFSVELAGAQNIDAINVVPEPSTWAMLGLGTAGTDVVTLRRHRDQA